MEKKYGSEEGISRRDFLRGFAAAGLTLVLPIGCAGVDRRVYNDSEAVKNSLESCLESELKAEGGVTFNDFPDEDSRGNLTHYQDKFEFDRYVMYAHRDKNGTIDAILGDRKGGKYKVVPEGKGWGHLTFYEYNNAVSNLSGEVDQVHISRCAADYDILAGVGFVKNPSYTLKFRKDSSDPSKFHGKLDKRSRFGEGGGPGSDGGSGVGGGFGGGNGSGSGNGGGNGGGGVGGVGGSGGSAGG